MRKACCCRTRAIAFEGALRAVDRAALQRYAASGEPFGKAGAYGIQGRAAAFIERIDGSAIRASWVCRCTRPQHSCARRASTSKTGHERRNPDQLSRRRKRASRVVEHGAVQELHVERTLARGLVGNIYLGKVARVLPGMQSAFIDIGLERAAFLHVADIWHPRSARRAAGVRRRRRRSRRSCSRASR